LGIKNYEGYLRNMVHRCLICCFLIALLPLLAVAQSPHQSHLNAFENPDFQEERAYDKSFRIVSRGERNTAQKCLLKYEVYGFHPFWRGTAYENYDFGLLSTVAYYGCEVDPATGLPADLHQWNTTQIVERAHASGSRVDLTAYLYGREPIQIFLSDTLRQQTLADTLAGLLKQKDADGICLDFQGVGKAMALAFGRFLRRMIITLREASPDYQLSLILPASDPVQGYDAGVLATYVDRFIIAAYDYQGQAERVAGPVAPLEDGQVAGASVNESVSHYLTQGAPKEKLLLGVPYFGYKWQTQSPDPQSALLDKGEIVSYQQFMQDYRIHEVQRDSASGGSYRTWMQGNVNQQMWVDDINSLSRKYGFVKQNDLAGIGIWALGYDHGEDALWELIRDRLADCDAVATQEFNKKTRLLDGPTSAERNKNHWMWMMGGMVGFLIIVFFVRRMK
jgi:spore germination protein YaaH